MKRTLWMDFLLCLRLIRHGRGPLCSFFSIAQIIIFDRLQFIIKFIYKRQACWDIYFWDGLIGNIIQIFHQRADAVPMCCNDHTLARFYNGSQRGVPVRENTFRVILSDSVAGSSLGDKEA